MRNLYLARQFVARTAVIVLLGGSALVSSPLSGHAQSAENCTASVFNRTAALGPENGSFTLANIPADQGFFRVRITCAQTGLTLGGQSEFFVPVENGTIAVGAIPLGVVEPPPTSLTLSVGFATLTETGATSQLTVTGTLPDGSTQNLTAQSTGTSYTTSNSAIATVSPDGLVTASSISGTAIVSARNEGALATVFITVALAEDTDGDGLPDDFELANGLNPADASDAALDPDADGLTNLQEFQAGTELLIADTDGDGLLDGDEVTRGTNPLSPDSDFDGLLDGDEISLGTNALNGDSDGDGLPDGVEVNLGLNPLQTDSDSNGIPDAQEDTDGDGLSNGDEVGLFTDPGDPDTDGDGINDGTEVVTGQDPLVPETVPPTVTVANPVGGANVVEGQTIIVAIDATDNGRVDSVDISVSGEIFRTDKHTPYELAFTVPFGVSSLTFGATATDVAGNVATTLDNTVFVAPSSLTTVEGIIVDSLGAPVTGAQVSVRLGGLSAEFFDFTTPLSALPDLTGLTPDITRVISAPNIRNPNQLFGNDPFGVGLGPDYAARFTGLLKIQMVGQHTFILGADEGARLIIDGVTVIDIPTGTGEFQEASATIPLTTGIIPIEVLYYEGVGDAELQVSYILPGGERRPILPFALMPAGVTFTTTSGPAGTFSIPNVPVLVEEVIVRASTTLGGLDVQRSSSPALPVPGGITNVGTVTLGPPVMYGGVGRGSSSNPGGLIIVDQGTGAGTLVGDPITPGGLTGIAIDSDGALFGSTISSPEFRSTLVRIDADTGSLISVIGPVTDGLGGPAISIGDLAFQPGTDALFGARSLADSPPNNGGKLYTIDVRTGIAALVGDTLAGSSGGIAFAPDGTLFQASWSNNFDFTSLNTLDPADASRINTVPVFVFFDGLGIRPTDGAIFATQGGQNQDAIYILDPVTGAETFVGRPSAGKASDLDFR